MSWVATAVAAVTTVVSTATTLIAADKQKSAAEDAALANKQRLDAEARNREAEAAESIKRQRLRDKREKAALRARLAQSGSLTTSGTPLALLGDLAATQELAIQDAVRAANADATALRDKGNTGIWESKQANAAIDNQSIGAVADGVASGVGLYTRTKRTT